MAENAEWIYAEDIIYVRTEITKKEKGGFIVYRTKDGFYRECTSVDRTLSLWEKEDGFIKTDKGRLANLTKDPELDAEFKLIKYNIASEIEFVTIAKSRFDKVKRYFDKLILRK